MKAFVTGGSFHPVDSSEMAFEIAASMAVRHVWEKMKFRLLEPVMKTIISVPEDYVGDAINDINSRRGEVTSIEHRGVLQEIEVHTPLSEMFGYATALRSITQGRATFSMEFEKFEMVPKRVAEEIISKYRGY